MSSSSGAPTPNEDADPAPTAPVTHGEEETAAVHPLIERFVAYRKSRGWTQEQAAERLQIPLNTLRGYECGNRNPGGANTEKILALVGLPKRRRAG